MYASIAKFDDGNAETLSKMRLWSISSRFLRYSIIPSIINIVPSDFLLELWPWSSINCANILNTNSSVFAPGFSRLSSKITFKFFTPRNFKCPEKTSLSVEWAISFIASSRPSIKGEKLAICSIENVRAWKHFTF